MNHHKRNRVISIILTKLSRYKVFIDSITNLKNLKNVSKHYNIDTYRSTDIPITNL